MSNPYTNEKDMNDYNRGKRDIMLEMAKTDLEETASRIAILEEELFEARCSLILYKLMIERGNNPQNPNRKERYGS